MQSGRTLPARAPLPEDAKRNRILAEGVKRRKDRREAWKQSEIQKRSQNTSRTRSRRAHEEDVSSDEDPSSSPARTSDEEEEVD